MFFRLSAFLVTSMWFVFFFSFYFTLYFFLPCYFRYIYFFLFHTYSICFPSLRLLCVLCNSWSVVVLWSLFNVFFSLLFTFYQLYSLCLRFFILRFIYFLYNSSTFFFNCILLPHDQYFLLSFIYQFTCVFFFFLTERYTLVHFSFNFCVAFFFCQTDIKSSINSFHYFLSFFRIL